MRSLTYTFDELPLVLFDGSLAAAMINGRVEVLYDRYGDWRIGKVELECHKSLTQDERDAGATPWSFMPAPDHIARLVVARFENTPRWSKRLSEVVEDRLSDHRIDELISKAERLVNRT